MRRAESIRLADERARRAARALFAPSNRPLWIIAAVVLTGVALFIALGGLAPAPDTARAAGPDEEVRTSLYAVTVLDAELTDEVEEQYFTAEEGDELLVMTLRLENLTSRPVGTLNSADGVAARLIGYDESLLELSGVTPTDSARTWRVGTSTSAVLQPGVPAAVQVAWPVRKGSFPDGVAVLNVFDARERAGRFIVSSRDFTWLRTDKIARISVEVSP